MLGLQPAQLADRAALQGSQPWSSQLVRTCRAAFSSLFPFSLVWGTARQVMRLGTCIWVPCVWILML